MRHTMTRLDKVALSAAVSGAIFNVFLFGIGATLHDATGGPLFYLRVVAAVLQASAFDLVAIATVMGMYRGQRSAWSFGTACAAALVSILIALDVAGVWVQPWLHAANPLIVLTFTLHLLAPPKLDATERQRLSTAEQRVSELEHMLSAAQQELSARQTIEVIQVARYRLTYEQFAKLAGASVSTIRRRLPEIATVIEQDA